MKEDSFNKKIGDTLTNNLNGFTPTHGVAIGRNPHQPETQRELELAIKALRLINVGEIPGAKQTIEKANFNVETKQWLKAELKALINFL